MPTVVDLPGTVWPEEAEDLARLHLQRQSVESHDVAFLLRGRVDLPQSFGSDSDRHGADCKRSSSYAPDIAATIGRSGQLTWTRRC
jgi:hypothetical protein